jgi:tRNA G18 (ribose-2'-O)-methylase SpoU
MPRIPIDELDDPRIAPYRHLKRSNLTRGSDLFVVEGPKLLGRLLESPFPLESILVTDRHEARIAARVPGSVPLYVVPHARLNALVGFHFHQGVLACGHRRPSLRIDELHASLGERATVVVCPGLNNPENLGAIIRIGDVLRADAVLVSEHGCPDPLSRRVLRVSMGASLRLPVVISADLERDALRLNSEYGFALVAAVVDPSAEPLPSFRRRGRLALVLGSESEGLDASWVARSDRRITIPMRAGAESLNVAVAAGILLYHLVSTDSE